MKSFVLGTNKVTKQQPKTMNKTATEKVSKKVKKKVPEKVTPSYELPANIFLTGNVTEAYSLHKQQPKLDVDASNILIDQCGENPNVVEAKETITEEFSVEIENVIKPILSETEKEDNIVPEEDERNKTDDNNVLVDEFISVANAEVSLKVTEDQTRDLDDKLNNSKNSYSCSVCKKIFASLKCYGTHTTKCIREMVCSKCNKPFKSSKTLRQHLKFMHIEVKKCDSCNKIFTTDNKLQKHKTDCHSFVKENKCIKCSVVFKNKKSLSVHKATKLCSKEAGSVNKGNQKMIENGENAVRNRTLKCGECHKSFKSARGLRGHKQTHKIVSLQNKPIVTIPVEDEKIEDVVYYEGSSDILSNGIEGVDYIIVNVLDTNMV